MTDPTDRTVRSSTGERSRLADLIGQVVLVVGEGTPAGAFDSLLDRYRLEGFAVVTAANSGTDAVTLVGRDGETAESFPAATRADDPALTQAIERELFASE